jgi:ABC-2 type transport system permease protein
VSIDAQTNVQAPASARGGYPLHSVIASEFTKLRTVRSTMWSFGTLFILAVGLGALATSLASSHWTQMRLDEQLTFDPLRQSLVGVFFGQFAIGVLGVLAISAEYATGTIRVSLAAVPKRSYLLFAKVIVFGVSALIMGEIVAFVSFFVGQMLLTSPAPHVSIGTHGVLASVAGVGLYLCLLGLLALGLATIIRHTAAAVSAYISILLVVPIIVSLLPSSISNTFGRFLPASIGHSVVSQVTGPHEFSIGIGLLLLGLYAAIALGIGGYLLARRDA